MRPLLTLTAQDKYNVAILVTIGGDRSSYFTIFELAAINKIYAVLGFI